MAWQYWAKKKAGEVSVIEQSNLRAFFSFRQLSGYSGNCIQVQRTSDNSTQDIGFVSGYLDTASIDSFCSGTTGKIRTWYNQKSGWYDIQNTTHSTQPIIYNSGSLTSYNGKPAALFDAGYFLLSTGGTNSALDIDSKAIYAVCKMNSFLNVSYLSWGQGNSGILLNADLAGFNGFAYIQSNSVLFTNNQENTNENIISLFGNPDKKILNNNANEATTASAMSDHGFYQLGRSGTTGGMKGYFKEILVYDTASNYANKDSIINEINTYYSVY